MTSTVRVEVKATLSSLERQIVTEVVQQATGVSGVNALSEQALFRLAESALPGHQHLLAWSVNQPALLAGYAQVNPTDEGKASTEIVVRPSLNTTTVGQALLHRMTRSSPRFEIQLWAHGRHSPVHELAHEWGYAAARELLQLGRSFTTPIPDVPVPEGYQLRTFHPDSDDHAWLALNAAVFAHHPEQGQWTAADLAHRMAEPWFDPAGFFLAERAVTAQWGSTELAGFHWTKIHGDSSSTDRDQRIGEVYVMGVSPDHQRRGVAAALMVTGLRYLRSQGIDHVVLYVDATNQVAVRAYERMGFTAEDADVQYALPASPRSTMPSLES
ncbi:MAG: mycothiol synthase [Actinomycetota bacterium]